MHPISCQQCGYSLDDATLRCPACGMANNEEHLASDATAEAREEQLRHLLEQARQCHQRGDIADALCYAREALALRQDCSTTHALLGQLYEQQGDATVARYHFQCALQVTIPTTEEEALQIPQPQPARRPQSGVMMLVLVACLVFSGIAAILTFRTEQRRDANLGLVLNVPTERPPLPTAPRWTWNVPKPSPMPESNTNAAPTTPATAVTVATTHTEAGPATSGPQPTADSPTAEPEVLGPSVHTRERVDTIRPSLDAADQAYFRGEYDRAVIIYEAVLAEQEKPNPRLYQDLAWCYQQLGNSQKAAEHLQRAMQGYRTVLETDPNSSTAQQGMASCQSALNALLTTRERDVAP